MKAVLIMGSTYDEPHAKKITDKLDEFGISWEQNYVILAFAKDYYLIAR